MLWLSAALVVRSAMLVSMFALILSLIAPAGRLWRV